MKIYKKSLGLWQNILMYLKGYYLLFVKILKYKSKHSNFEKY